jgi:hypothetical protein
MPARKATLLHQVSSQCRSASSHPSDMKKYCKLFLQFIEPWKYPPSR